MLRHLQFDGCSFSYRIIGQGPPAVFIQGAGIHGDGWRPQTDSLGANYRCLSFDNRGMASSQPPAKKITVEQMAADTLAIMDAEGIGAAHIVGHSLGGIVAQQIALTSRHRVRSLALLCTSARGADATRLTATMLWLGIRSRIGTRRSRAHAFLEIIMPADFLATQDRDALAEKLTPLLGHSPADTPSIVMPQLNALKRFDATSRLSQLTGVPTLVIAAAQDVIFPSPCGRHLAEGIPDARYIEVPNAAHGLPLHLPGLVNTALLEHMRTA